MSALCLFFSLNLKDSGIQYYSYSYPVYFPHRSLSAYLNESTVDHSCIRSGDNVIRAPYSEAQQKYQQLVDVTDMGYEIQAQDYSVLMGNRKWIKEKNFIDIPMDIENKLIAQEKLGHTAILAAIDGTFFVARILRDILF